MEIENPEIADGVTICSPALHAGVRKLSGELCGAADEEGDRSGFAAVDLGRSAKDDVHVEGGFAFAKDDGSIGAYALCSMSGQPRVLVFGKILERAETLQGGNNVGWRRGLGWRGEFDAGKERGWSGEVVTIQC